MAASACHCVKVHGLQNVALNGLRGQVHDPKTNQSLHSKPVDNSRVNVDLGTFGIKSIACDKVRLLQAEFRSEPGDVGTARCVEIFEKDTMVFGLEMPPSNQPMAEILTADIVKCESMRAALSAESVRHTVLREV